MGFSEKLFHLQKQVFSSFFLKIIHTVWMQAFLVNLKTIPDTPNARALSHREPRSDTALPDILPYPDSDPDNFRSPLPLLPESLPQNPG